MRALKSSKAAPARRQFPTLLYNKLYPYNHGMEGGFSVDQGIDFESCYNVLQYISSSLNSNTQVKHVLHAVVMKVSELLKAKGALVRTFNLETQEMELGAAYGMGDHYLSKGPVSGQVVMT